MVVDAACGEGHGAALLLDGGARSVHGVANSTAGGLHDLPDRAASFSLAAGDATALPFETGSFDLAVWFPDVDFRGSVAAAIDELRRVITGQGVLLAAAPAVGASPATPDGHPAAGKAPLEDDFEASLRRRFRYAVRYEHYRCTASVVHGPFRRGMSRGWIRGDRAAVRAHRAAFAASDAEATTLPPVALIEEPLPGGVTTLADPAAAWEERARGAEAEAAAVRWELTVSREISQATLERLTELEGRPLRRITRWLGGGRLGRQRSVGRGGKAFRDPPDARRRFDPLSPHRK